MSTRRKGKNGEYNGYPVLPTYFGSYAIDGLAMALHACYNTNNFLSAITHAVNLLGDADSTGSIAGQIAGAFYGYSSIKQHAQRLIDEMNRHCDGDIAYRAVLLHHAGAQYFNSDASKLPQKTPAQGSQTSQDTEPAKSGGLSTGMIVFLVVAGVLLVAGFSVGAYCYMRPKKLLQDSRV